MMTSADVGKSPNLSHELGQTHLNFIENKGFINICSNLAIEKD